MKIKTKKGIRRIRNQRVFTGQVSPDRDSITMIYKNGESYKLVRDGNHLILVENSIIGESAYLWEGCAHLDGGNWYKVYK